MERSEKERVRRRHECPSFSSTLLDVIYRSIDDSDKGGAVPAAAAAAAAAARERVFVSPRNLPPISSSSSSDNSSYSGVSSSSEPDSAAIRRPQIRSIRTAPPPCRSSSAHLPPLRTMMKQDDSLPANNHRERTESTSIRSKLRDLGRRTKAPESPGSRLAVLLNSLFPNAAGRQRKSKPPPTSADDFSWSAPSAHSRPCLVKTPSSRRAAAAAEEEGAKRSVRFHPVSVVMGLDRLPQGQKTMRHGDRSEAAAAAADEGKGRKEARLKVEDILRRFEVEEDEMSDSSSDLFELDNLAVKAGGGGGYRDELPVYETTHRATNCAISRSLVHQRPSK